MNRRDAKNDHGSDADLDVDLVLRVERAKGRNRRKARWERDVWEEYVAAGMAAAG